MSVSVAHQNEFQSSGTSPTRGVRQRPAVPVLTLAKIFLIAHQALESRTIGVRA